MLIVSYSPIFYIPLQRFTRKIGRVIECAGLEIRYTLSGYRGFESLIFRKMIKESQMNGSP